MDTAVAEVAEGEPQEPWYVSMEGYEESDKGIWSKYPTRDDAIRSIPGRERKLNDLKIEFPDEKAAPDDRDKAHRAILRRMGAPKKADGYQQIVDVAVKNLPDGVKNSLPEDFFKTCCEEALELNYLPSQFERHLAMALAHVESTVRSRQDARDAAEAELAKIFGHKKDAVLGNADKACDSYDGDMFRKDNSAIPEQERTERGGVVKQMWNDLKGTRYGPILARILNFNHDRLFSEGDGSIHGLHGAKADDVYTTDYKEAQRRWPKRGESEWKRYADEKAKGRRAIAV